MSFLNIKQNFCTKYKTNLTTKTGFIKEDSSLGDVIAYISTTDQDNGQNSMTNIKIFDEGLFVHKHLKMLVYVVIFMFFLYCLCYYQYTYFF